jgi:hypothetical protein
VLPPGDYRVVHVGAGASTSHDLYMNAGVALFPNASVTSFLGDGAYLLDHKTAMRAYDEYPCIASCTDPLQGHVIISKVNAKSSAGTPARRANQEYVVIKNTGTTPALMDGYYLRRRTSTCPLLINTVIPAGGTLTIRIGSGTPTATTQYWGRPSTLLNDAADSVALLSNKNVLIDAVRWTRPNASGLHR